MTTDPKKNDPQIDLIQQHRNEWNASLAHEAEARSALYSKHEEERTQLYLEEINFHERAILASRQQDEINELRHQSREARIATQKRHIQENESLNQPPE